jgi:probable rRNA maturation factor
MSGRSQSAAAPVLDVSIESPLWSGLDVEAIAEQAIGAALAETDTILRPGCAISLSFCDDAAIRSLNREWRDADKPTNVLSFQAVEPQDVPRAFALGDLAIAFETTRREASEEGKTLEDHLRHLIVHGALHLLGYDHDEDEEAEEMEAIERRALARIGVADPYADAELAGAEPSR